MEQGWSRSKRLGYSWDPCKTVASMVKFLAALSAPLQPLLITLAVARTLEADEPQPLMFFGAVSVSMALHVFGTHVVDSIDTSENVAPGPIPELSPLYFATLFGGGSRASKLWWFLTVLAWVPVALGFVALCMVSVRSLIFG